MSETEFDLDAWLNRIGHEDSREPTLATLRALVAAHTATIPFENVDVLLGRPPKLDLASLQRKIVFGRRGGYCFELNGLFKAGLSALGFNVTGMIGRVIRGLEDDAQRPATHMVNRVALPEGDFLADVGFGNATPTSPLGWRPREEQTTPHETMRLWPVGEDLALQVRHGEIWQNLYRILPHPALAADYEVANWFTATHPASPFVSNLIAARPGPDGARLTFLNGRLSVRRPGIQPERTRIEESALRSALENAFGLSIADTDVAAALAMLDQKGTRGAHHPAFS